VRGGGIRKKVSTLSGEHAEKKGEGTGLKNILCSHILRGRGPVASGSKPRKEDGQRMNAGRDLSFLLITGGGGGREPRGGVPRRSLTTRREEEGGHAHKKGLCGDTQKRGKKKTREVERGRPIISLQAKVLGTGPCLK